MLLAVQLGDCSEQGSVCVYPAITEALDRHEVAFMSRTKRDLVENAKGECGRMDTKTGKTNWQQKLVKQPQ